MVCVYCGSKTKVNNSRHQSRANYIWRRRECPECGNIFTTEERTELSGVLMVRRAGKLQPFNRDNLFLSIYESCRHRPNALSEAGPLTQTIINNLAAAHREGELERAKIIDATLRVLNRFDKVAATMYAAYHR